MERAITGFLHDAHGDWIAELACGHRRHVRHRPPWFDRPWTLTEAGREAMRGRPLHCGLCAQGTAATPASDFTDPHD